MSAIATADQAWVYHELAYLCVNGACWAAARQVGLAVDDAALPAALKARAEQEFGPLPDVSDLGPNADVALLAFVGHCALDARKPSAPPISAYNWGAMMTHFTPDKAQALAAHMFGEADRPKMQQ